MRESVGIGDLPVKIQKLDVLPCTWIRSTLPLPGRYLPPRTGKGRHERAETSAPAVYLGLMEAFPCKMRPRYIGTDPPSPPHVSPLYNTLGLWPTLLRSCNRASLARVS